jgi:hypothetical protein
MNISEISAPAQAKWFSGLSARFRDYATIRDTAQIQKEAAAAADAARIKTKSAGAATKSDGARSAARANIGQVINAIATPKTFEFGGRAGGMPDNTGILNEIGQSIAYMKQLALQENAEKENVKPPKPEESYGHWEDDSAVTRKENLNRANALQADGVRYLDTATLHLIETVDENRAASGGLLHLDDDKMDFADAAGNVYSLGRLTGGTSCP